MLENTKPGRAMLGDADDWDALQKAQSIIVGGPETVYRQIIDLVRETQVGNLLIQFHLGNMRDDLARKSMRLFATQVAPRLRRKLARGFRQFLPGARRRRLTSRLAHSGGTTPH